MTRMGERRRRRCCRTRRVKWMRKRWKTACRAVPRRGRRICSDRRALRRRCEAECAKRRAERSAVVRFQRKPKSEGVGGRWIEKRLTACRGMPRSRSPLSRGTLHTRTGGGRSRVRSRLGVISRSIEVELLRVRQHWRMRTLSRDCRRLGVGLGARFGFGEFTLESLDLGFQCVDFAAADGLPAFFLGREIAHDE